MENGAGPQVIDLASFISGGKDEGKKTLTFTIEKVHQWVSGGNGVCCFAGASDELVVAASRERDLHIWSVPEGRFDADNNQQFMHLTFICKQVISGLFYNKERSTLIASGRFYHVNSWTSFKLPQLPTDN